MALSVGVLVALAFAGDASSGSVAKPIDSQQQLSVAWGKRSFWLQPWRGYLDTWPATRMLSSVGINFNVGTGDAQSTARLLAANGFRAARLEEGWGNVDYANPNILDNLSGFTARLQALQAYGIRPLILLNANDTDPCPVLPLTVNITAPALKGALVLHLDAASAAQVVPGKTGLSGLATDSKVAAVLFTSVDATGTATLSKPLPENIPAGSHKASTLLYVPFANPYLVDGVTPNPAFEDTMAGWLHYVGLVTRTATSILGNGAFDVEIWNELSNGSAFLNVGAYYNPDPSWEGTGKGNQAILARTVAYLRDPANGVSTVGIGNGFANESPWPAGSTSPLGLTAIDKHPYSGLKSFPLDALYNGSKPIDALGNLDGVKDAFGDWHDNFVPTYTSFFPEYSLTATQTESLIRDLSPYTTGIQGVSHGRNTAPTGGVPPVMWVTEMNMNPHSEWPLLSDAAFRHIQAKGVLRTLASFVGKGVSSVYFYAASGNTFGLVDPAFFSASSYPGDNAGGETISAVSRFVSAFSGAQALTSVTPLSLVGIADTHDSYQWLGNGLVNHPALYDRDVVAAFPFEISPTQYVVPAYVMTRNFAKLYNPLAPSDPAAYDMPAESFQLSINGLPRQWTFSAVDPLTGASVPVTILAKVKSKYTIDVPLTDSPRLITITKVTT